VKGAGPPVDAESLGQKGGDDQAGPVREEALIGELAHAGVHDRIPGAALLPGVQPPVGTLPATSPLPIVVVGNVWPGRQHLVVEVPPAELAGEVLEAPSLVDAREGLVRGQAAEMQIGAQVRRGVRRQVVGQIHVPSRPSSKPAAEAVAAGGLPAGRQVVCRRLPGEIGDLGKPPAAQARR
jgi:hypothetical protein